MMKRIFFAFLLSLSALLAHASGEILTYEKFVYLSDAQKDKVIINTMEMMAEMESKHGKNPKTTFQFKRLQEIFLSNAYAAPLKSWRDYAREYTTLLKKPNNIQCVYAGWVSQVINGDCVQPSTLSPKSDEYKTYISGGGVTGTATISCNPVIFGFKQEKAGSLFTVPAGKTRGNAHNSSYNCMKKSLESSEGDIPADRLEFLRKQLTQNPAVVNDVYKFLNQACLCPEPTPGMSKKYHEYMVPHRTCYGLMNMMATTVLCEVPDKSQAMDVSFFKELKNFTVSADVTGEALDKHYAKFLSDLRQNKSSEVAALCKSLADGDIKVGMGPNPNGNGTTTSGSNGSTSADGGNSNGTTTNGANSGEKSNGTTTSGTNSGGSPGIIVKNTTPLLPNLDPKSPSTGPTLTETPKTFIEQTPVKTTTPITPVVPPENEIVVTANKCLADCRVPVGKKGSKDVPMICNISMKNPTQMRQIDKTLSSPQMDVNGAAIKWLQAKFETDDIDDNDKPIKAISTQECSVTVTESDDTAPKCSAVCTPKGDKLSCVCSLSGTTKENPLTLLQTKFEDVDPKSSTVPGTVKDASGKEQKIDCKIEEPVTSGPSCTAKCTIPKDDPKAQMTCVPSGNLKPDEPINFSSSEVLADRKDKTIKAKYKEDPDAETEKEIECKVEEPTEAAPKPTVSIKNIGNFPTTSKFEATMKGVDGKEGKPEGWTLVWTRKRDKDLKLTKPKVKPAAKTSEIEDKFFNDSDDADDKEDPKEPKVETEIPDAGLDIDKEKSEQPRAAKDYDVCATLHKGKEKSATSCLVVPKIKVGNVNQPGNGQMQQPQTPPGAMKAGGVQ